MLRGRTVFVVGAGASAEFGLPVGSELALNISNKLNVLFDDWGREIVAGDRQLFLNVAKQDGQHPNHSAWQKAAWLIRDGIILAHSIDDFLDAHQHDPRVVAYGKAAIAQCILEAERGSTLFFDPHARSRVPGRPATIDMDRCADTWLAGLMKLLVRALPYAERAKIFDQCSFVIFNYDRCVEHFFLHALQRFYNISADESAQIVGTMRIYHPYGLAGQLDALGGGQNVTPFGSSQADYYAIGNSVLKTYTESVETEEIQKAVSEAEKIVFLGFAYHDQNMKILSRLETMDLKSSIGTALGMSGSDMQVVKDQVGAWAKEGFRPFMRDRISLHENLKAKDIFSFYSKSL